MPEKKQTVQLTGVDASTIQAMAFASFHQLNWNIKYAARNLLVAHTPRKAFAWDDEVTVETADGQMTVTSKMIHGESFDLRGRNKKHIAEFLSTFEQVKPIATPENLAGWKEAIARINEQTLKAAEVEVQQAQEIDKVMNLSTGSVYLTYTIMGVNVLMFILTALGGVNIMAPGAFDLLPWGANYPPLTYNGEWWRLFTCMFLHFGIIHLALNLYALYSIAIYLEPMLGKLRYLVAYLCSGILASVVSLWWHKDGNVVSAGASGAIFGMYGVFLALLTTNLIPKQLRSALMQSILIFVGYNVIYGFRPNSGIDNAAHLGGLVSGMIIGYLFHSTLKPGASLKRTPAIAGLIVLATILVSFASLRDNQDDNKLFELRLTEFSLIEEKAAKPYSKESVTLEDLETVIIPGYEAAARPIDQMKSYELNATNDRKRKKLTDYVRLRIEEAKLRRRAIKEDSFDYNERINEIVRELNQIVGELGGNE